jgi:tetratricopeptide (TPR) repeat protein
MHIKEKQIDNAKQVLQQGKNQGVLGEKFDALEEHLTLITQVPKSTLPEQKKSLTLSEKRKKLAEQKKQKKAKKQNLKALSPSEAEIKNLLQHYQNGQYGDAEKLAVSIIQEFPKHQFAWKALGVVLKQTGRISESLVACKKSVQLAPQDGQAQSNLGITLQELGRLEEAEASFKQSIALNPGFAHAHYNLANTLKGLGRLKEAESSFKQSIALKADFAEAHSNLGATLQELGRLEEAEANYRQAMALKPDYALAHSNLGVTLQELGRLEESEAILRQAIALEPALAEAHSNLGMTLNAMGSKEIALKHFERNLQLKRGVNSVDLHHKSFREISNAKLDHDIEQFEYLAASGSDIKKFQELAMLYKTVKSEINHTSDTDVLTLSDKHQRLLGSTYNRPIHILEAPALDKSAIGDSLDVTKITEDYFEHEFGLTYIDDFLSPSALMSLRKFLLGSTIWFDFFHKGGYMGAYLSEGLASPLVLQIAEDLREKFPKIFKHHQLTQLWAYKYDSRACQKNNSFRGINVHADFAAINVNFWIAPNSANLDPSSGGLVVYNTEAPIEWDFKTYNHNEQKIREEILKSNQKKTIVPHNENRAVIFNSNLFHETDNIEFKEGYENRRINVTILFGRREL